MSKAEAKEYLEKAITKLVKDKFYDIHGDSPGLRDNCPLCLLKQALAAMDEQKNVLKEVLRHLEAATKETETKKITGHIWTAKGLVEHIIKPPCQTCGGSGKVKRRLAGVEGQGCVHGSMNCECHYEVVLCPDCQQKPEKVIYVPCSFNGETPEQKPDKFVKEVEKFKETDFTGFTKLEQICPVIQQMSDYLYNAIDHIKQLLQKNADLKYGISITGNSVEKVLQRVHELNKTEAPKGDQCAKPS